MDKERFFLTDLLASSTGAIFVSGLISVLLPIFVLWDGINQRYISQGLIAFEVKAGDTSELLFAYIPKEALGTISTAIFWGLAAMLGIFIVWIVESTYRRIVSVLTVAADYENKSLGYMGEVAKLLIERIVVAIVAMGALLVVLKLVIPKIISLISLSLLASEVTVFSVLLTLFWIAMLWLLLVASWLIAKLTFQSVSADV